MRSSWLIRLTNWSFMRSVARASVMSVPTKFQPACAPWSSVRGVIATETVRCCAVGGHVGPVADVAAVLLGRVHERGEPGGRSPRVLGGRRELLGQVELQDRPLPDDVRARQAEHLLRARVPDADDAVAVGADDRLLGDRVDDAGHRLRAGGEHAGGQVELVGAGLHLGQQQVALAPRAARCGPPGRRAGGCVSVRPRPPRPTASGPSSSAPSSGRPRRCCWRAVRGAGARPPCRARRGGRRAGRGRRPAPGPARGPGRARRPRRCRPTAGRPQPSCSRGTTTATSSAATAARSARRATSAARNAEPRPASDEFAVRHGQHPGGEQDGGDGEQRRGRQRRGRAAGAAGSRGRTGARGRRGPRCRPRRWSCRLPVGERAHLVRPGRRPGTAWPGRRRHRRPGRGRRRRGRRRPTAAGCGCRRWRGSARSAAHTSRPVAPGMETSRTARSGSSARAASSAAAPSATDGDDGAAGLAHREARRGRGCRPRRRRPARGRRSGRRPRWLPSVRRPGDGADGVCHQGQRPAERVPAARRERPSPLGVSRSRRQHCAPPGEPGGAQSVTRWAASRPGIRSRTVLCTFVLGLLGLALHVLRRRTGPRP